MAEERPDFKQVYNRYLLLIRRALWGDIPEKTYEKLKQLYESVGSGLELEYYSDMGKPAQYRYTKRVSLDLPYKWWLWDERFNSMKVEKVVETPEEYLDMLMQGKQPFFFHFNIKRHAMVLTLMRFFGSLYAVRRYDEKYVAFKVGRHLYLVLYSW